MYMARICVFPLFFIEISIIIAVLFPCHCRSAGAAEQHPVPDAAPGLLPPQPVTSHSLPSEQGSCLPATGCNEDLPWETGAPTEGNRGAAAALSAGLGTSGAR